MTIHCGTGQGWIKKDIDSNSRNKARKGVRFVLNSKLKWTVITVVAVVCITFVGGIAVGSF